MFVKKKMRKNTILLFSPAEKYFVDAHIQLT